MPANALLTGDSDNPLYANAPTWADAWTFNKGAIGDYIAQQRALAVQQGLWDPDTNRPTQAGLLAAAHGYGNALLMGTTAPGIRAYHGSPYSFDAFDASKIGTGEGAQAYGHGLYFAGNEGVARSYRDALAPTFAPRTPEAHAANALEDTNNDVAAATQRLAGQINAARAAGASDADVAALRQAHSILTNDPRRITGSMYEVNIGSDPAHFLDLDKRMSDHSEAAQNAIRPLMQTDPALKEVWLGNPYGSEVYGQLAKRVGPEAASKALLDAGVPGIRYLDAGSRAQGEGSRNVVVFDPATIEILRKYGIAGLGLGLGAAATQGADQQQ